MMYNSKFTRFLPKVNRFLPDIPKTLSSNALRLYGPPAIATTTVRRKLATYCRFKVLEISAQNGINRQAENKFQFTISGDKLTTGQAMPMCQLHNGLC